MSDCRIAACANPHAQPKTLDDIKDALEETYEFVHCDGPNGHWIEACNWHCAIKAIDQAYALGRKEAINEQ